MHRTICMFATATVALALIAAPEFPAPLRSPETVSVVQADDDDTMITPMDVSKRAAKKKEGKK